MKLLLLLAVTANAVFVASSDGGSSVESSSSTSSLSSSSSYSSCSSSSSSSSSSSTSFDSIEDCSEEEKCGKNERYVDCPATLCEPKTCDDLGCSFSCAIIEEDEECPVKPACVCIDDYVRNSKGVCIPRDKCPSCGGDPNAVSGCGNNCGRLCSNYYKANISCTLICKANGCDCRENYVYDEEAKKCVLPEECSNTCAKANEVFDPCPSPCPFRTCGIDDRVIFCAPGPKVGDPKCPPPVCRCKNGYYRNGDGECVTWEKCPKCPKPNEVFDPCPKLCPPQRCDVDERVIRCKAPPKLGDPECEPGCRCADGYVRNIKGICVTRDQCQKCTRPNEVFHPCPPTCPPQTCDSLTRDVICPGLYGRNRVSERCNPSCICQRDHYRNKIGECISKKDCLRCTGPHEYFSCGSACDNVCASLYKQNQTNYPIENVDCHRQCYCEKGYARDRHNICIPINQCPVSCAGDPNALPGCGVNCGRRCDNYFKKNVICPDICFDDGCDCRQGYVYDGNIKRCVRPEECTPVCGRDEIFSNCINGGCDAKYCSQLGKPVPCVRPKHCINGCLCKNGYLRDKNGTCVSEEKCPKPIQCGKHEIYEECPPLLCQALNCSQLGHPIACPEIAGPGCPFDPACICETGYLRNDDGVCIPEKNCPSCGGDANAVAGCGVNCGRLCSNYDIGPVSCIQACFPNACDCKKEYVLDENINKCVLPKHCSPQCGPNEQYEECPSSLCRAQNCSQLGYPIPCTGPANCTEKPACVCKDGYLRNDKDVCVLEEECPSCGGDPNAQPGCGGHCGRRCSTYNKGPVACPAICYLNACDCKEGYIYDDNLGTCVRPEECTPICCENEVYSECTNGGCQAKNCSQLGKPIPCIKINPKYCKKGCLCKEGYLRLENGTCVPQDECPPQCDGQNEVYDPCPPTCPPKQTCDIINKKFHCPIILDDPSSKHCNGTCRCKPGYYRNILNQCISKENCLKCNGPHEYYSCGGACDNLCSKLNIESQANCPIVNIKCNEKCYCEEGYARNDNKTCIPIDECKAPCGKNEEYNECPALSCKALNCSQLGYPVPCPFIPVNATCPSGPACICKDGYLRNKKGICVPENKCPSCGGDPNAKPGCGQNCGKRCSNYNKGPVVCALICKLNGCDCKEGYVYDDNIGKCVPPEECTPVCRNNEIYSSCIQAECRPQNCTQLGQSVSCPRIDPKYCRKGCLCKEGYLRDKNGTCIPEKECPICPPQTCEAIGKVYPCPLIPPGSEYCKPDCRCENGFYKNKNNECISKDDCLKCTGPHEFFSCGSACDNECSEIHKQNRTNCPIINKTCNKKCYCEDGYARNKNKTCIPIDECKVLQCGEHEVYEECPSSLCRPQKCSQVGYPMDCSELPNADSCPEEPACVCKDGYVRNKERKCIPIKKCPLCGGDPNAAPGCGVNCNKHCYDLHGSPRGCPKICRVNACDCKDDYYYDDNIGICVSHEQCTPTCGDDEVFSDCVNGGCDMKNCSQLGKPTLCINPLYCIAGCLCKEGYLRADNGTCVPEDQCKPSCTNPNEFYDPCPPTCPPQTCESISQIYNCPFIPANNTDKDCSGQCRCKPGYLRNIKDECISEEDCLKCTGLNEYFSCGSACDNVCTTLFKQNQTNCPMKNIKCTDKCYCEEGHARDKNNNCIPIEECPEPRCREYERYEECPSCVRTPQHCSELGYPIPCRKSACDDEEPACVCIDGYVRNKTGECIPATQCPSCGGDPNAKAGCGMNCNRHCSDYNREPGACVELCKTNACDCKEGFYHDDNIDKCVLLEECTQVCEENEVYDTCINGGCDMKNCSQLGKPTLCIDPVECEDGCICKSGYLRDDGGTCIPEDECYLCPETTSKTPPPTTTTPEPEYNSTELLRLVNEGGISYTGVFAYKRYLMNPGTSFIASPFSVFTPLALLGYFSENSTLDQILAVLNLKNKEDILKAFKLLREEYLAQTSVIIETAVKCYVNKDNPTTELFDTIAEKYFGSESQNVDFTQAQQTANTINKWVEEKTHDKIKNLVSPSMFSGDTRLALVNAIYFMGNWTRKFNIKDTETKDFYVTNNKTIQIPMMHQMGFFNYGEDDDLNSQIVEIPYKGDNFSCIIVLPNDVNGLDSVMKKLCKNDTYTKATGNLRSRSVKITVPRFEIETKTDLAKMFEETNLEQLLNSSVNDIHISNSKEAVHVSSAVQKAYIKFNEAGTEATAANALILSRALARPVQEVVSFNANHPFVFFIKFLNTIIFCGVFYQ